MRRLPFVNEIKTIVKQLGTFQGVDKRDVIQENAFADMKNMSSDYYPALGSRKPRGEIIKEIAKPHGIFWKNGLAYVDGTELYYKNQKIGNVSDNDKQMIGMGAYILIFPDKVYYNTASGEFGDMQRSWTQSGQAVIAPTYEASTYIKITCAGIGKNFRQYDSVTIEGCTNASLNKSVTIQQLTDNDITIIGVLDKQFTQNSGLKLSRKIPDMDYVTECDNRLWGCSSKNHEIYASKLGDPLNFSSYEGIASDSYAATVGSDGDFTGAITHMGYVLFFKEDCFHKVFGNKPSNIQVNTQAARGVAAGCSRSLKVVNETLYYAGRNNICGFDGALPYSISDALKDVSYTEAAAEQYGNKYYISLKEPEGWKLYVYDQLSRNWYIEDNTNLKYSAYAEGSLYYIEGNKLRTITGNSSETVEWFAESGDQLEASMEKKYINKLQFMIEMDEGAMVEIFLKYDETEFWERLITITAEQKKTYTIPIKPRRNLHYRYRLEGRGMVKIFGLGKYIEMGSEK